MIGQQKHLEYTEDPEEDGLIEFVNERGAKALEIYREWKAKKAKDSLASNSPNIAIASERYSATSPYPNAKTARECEHALEQFQGFVGNVPISSVDVINVHDFAEFVGTNRSRKLIDKKLSYVRKMFDYAVRKGWVGNNVFAGLKL